MTQASTQHRVAGVDVGKDWLDLALPDGTHHRVANHAAGHEDLAALVRQAQVKQVGMEASGGYEQRLAAALRAQGLQVLVLQPIQVRSFARFRLRRAKSDAIDAALIQACAAALDARPAPDPRLAPLAEHLTLIEQIEEDRARAKTRLEHLSEARLRGLVTAEIRRLTLWRRDEVRRLLTTLRAHPDLARKLALLLSVPGIGERTALALIVRLPELGQLSREEVAALVGVAPFNHDSGRRAGERRIAGGRKRVRKSLFAAAQAAALRWNPALVALYARLTKAGKPHALAMVACARKLAIYANAVLARNAPWQTQT
jgi:transposase